MSSPEGAEIQAMAVHAVVEVLRARGVRYLFGLPGTTEAALLEVLREQEEVRYVLTLHEGVAVAMADGYARASGGPGVVNLHTTVGTLAGLSLLYNAWRDRVPVVVLACHKDTRILGRAGFTTLPDTTALVRPMAKWAHQTLNVEQVGEDVERAFQQALAPPQGPAYLLLPENLLAHPTRAVPPRPAPRPLAPRAHPQAVSEIAAQLIRAERPVLVAGSGIGRAGGVEVVRRLAGIAGLAVVWEPRRTLLEIPYPPDDPHFVGIYDPMHPGVREADVLLVLGAVLFVEFSPPPAPEVPPQACLIHVHPDAAELGRLYPPALAIQADPALLAQDLLAAVEARRDELEVRLVERRAWVGDLRARWEAQRSERWKREYAAVPLSAYRVGVELGKVLPVDAVVVEEAVRSSPGFLEGFPVRVGGVLRTSGGSLGWGVPAAMGVQMALPDRPVAAVVGDGCLHFTPQALWTGVRQRLPVLVVVLNNRKYLAVEAGVQRLRGSTELPLGTPGIDLSGIDHVTVAQGYGAGGIRVEDPDALGDALREGLRRAREEGRPYVVDVPVRDEPGS